MSLIREFLLILLLTAITGSILVLFFIWRWEFFSFIIPNTYMELFLADNKGSMAVPKGYRKVLQRLCIEMGIQKTISLYQGYGVEFPFIFGVRSPKIYLPIREFSEGELEMGINCRSMKGQ